MQELLHVIGICADHSSHPDVMDFILFSTDQVSNNTNYFRYFLLSFKIKVKKIIEAIF